MRRSTMPQPEMIQQLLVAGRAVAEGFLRDNGQVPPMMLAFSDEGMILHSAASMTHPKVKDDFAGACRLLARANRSTAVVLILEAWARIAPPGESIDTDIRPSTAPDRIEVVSLNAEIPGHGYVGRRGQLLLGPSLGFPQCGDFFAKVETGVSVHGQC